MTLLTGLGYCLVNGDDEIVLSEVRNYNMETLNPSWVSVDRLSVSQYPRWALVNFEYRDPSDAGGDVNVYVVVADEQGYTQQRDPGGKWFKPVHPVDGMTVMQINGGNTPLLTNRNADGNHRGEVDFPQSAASSFDPGKGQVGAYSVVLRDTKGNLPSERVYGLGLPLKQHVSYVLYFQRVQAPVTPPPARYHIFVHVVGSGGISREPNQVDYADGEAVLLSATPAVGFTFREWTGGLIDNPLEVVMHDDLNITATFEALPPVPPPDESELARRVDRLEVDMTDVEARLVRVEDTLARFTLRLEAVVQKLREAGEA